MHPAASSGLLRLDHVVIAVPQLSPAINACERLGLVATSEGRHAGRGTANAIVTFPEVYIELLTVLDPAAEVRGAGARGEALIGFLQRTGGGLIGYAMSGKASDVLARDAWRREPPPELGTVRRKRPDGSVLEWQIAWPGGVQWRRMWPFILEERAASTPAQTPNHPLGAIGIGQLAVAVYDLSPAISWYSGCIGAVLLAHDNVRELNAQRARMAVANVLVDLLAPKGDGSISRELAHRGEGVFEVTLAVADLRQALARLDARGVSTSSAPGHLEGRLIDPQSLFGARIVLASARGLPTSRLLSGG